MLRLMNGCLRCRSPSWWDQCTLLSCHALTAVANTLFLLRLVGNDLRALCPICLPYLNVPMLLRRPLFLGCLISLVVHPFTCVRVCCLLRYRYGLIGQNGCGKSTFLECLAAREVPIPEHMDIYLLAEEAPPTELSALNVRHVPVRSVLLIRRLRFDT